MYAATFIAWMFLVARCEYHPSTRQNEVMYRITLLICRWNAVAAGGVGRHVTARWYSPLCVLVYIRFRLTGPWLYVRTRFISRSHLNSYRWATYSWVLWSHRQLHVLLWCQTSPVATHGCFVLLLWILKRLQKYVTYIRFALMFFPPRSVWVFCILYLHTRPAILPLKLVFRSFFKTLLLSLTSGN